MKDNISSLVVKLGNDIVYIPKINKIFYRFGLKLLNKILINEEINYCINNNSVNLNAVAKRFSAKEAMVKALGIGFGSVASFKDIGVMNDSNNKPYLKLSDKVQFFIEDNLKIKNYSIDVSLSDDNNYALSTVIIVGYTSKGNNKC